MRKSGLSQNQTKTIRCILESNSIEEAAKKAKVSRGSIYNWMKDENFHKTLQKERDILFYESLDLLKQATTKAVKEFLNLLESENENTRRLAAKEILIQSLKIAEIRDLEIRMGRIENLIRENIRNG